MALEKRQFSVKSWVLSYLRMMYNEWCKYVWSASVSLNWWQEIFFYIFFIMPGQTFYIKAISWVSLYLKPEHWVHWRMRGCCLIPCWTWQTKLTATHKMKLDCIATSIKWTGLLQGVVALSWTSRPCSHIVPDFIFTIILEPIADLTWKSPESLAL